jgi:hypothetical protein
MISIPEQISCDDCNTGKKRLIHWAVGADVENEGDEPEGPWFWEIQNHDKTCRFKWPYTFDTKEDAWCHIHKILTEAKEATEGDTVV